MTTYEGYNDTKVYSRRDGGTHRWYHPLRQVTFPVRRQCVRNLSFRMVESKDQEVNRHTRTSDSNHANAPLKIQLTPNVLSKTRPMMFRLEVFDNGNVQLTKDGEKSLTITTASWI